MGLGRFELPTSPLSGVRSNQLSYRPGCTFELHPGSPAASLALLRLKTARLTSGALELSRKVSRTQLNMRSSYAALTVGVD